MWQACDQVNGVTCGIYSSYDDWVALFGSASYCSGQNHRLWYYNANNTPSFADYNAFGCWTTNSLWAKTYTAWAKFCGISLEQVYIPSQ